MFDWPHTVDTTDPAYYKWTQWVFLQLFKAGLAERKEAPVNWCPSCKTVLANEQVIGGRVRAVRHARRAAPHRAVVLQDHEVRPAPARQPGDDRLVGDHARRRRRTGSAGARARSSHFPGARRGRRRRPAATRRGLHDPTGHRLRRHLHGALAGAPAGRRGRRHPDHARAVDAYRDRGASRRTWSPARRSTRPRPASSPAATAATPRPGEAIPVWIADYVLMEYGTGAIMAVPGHDERDFEFASRSSCRSCGWSPDRTTTPTRPLDGGLRRRRACS